MIHVSIDHSYEEDYHYLSEITVGIKDGTEKERIEKIIKEKGIEGRLIDFPDRYFVQRLAKTLEVDVSLIDLDVNEIDLM